jgi:pyrroline-5-carboxylate reductase
MAGPSLGFIGSGRVAHIILGGLKRAGLMPAQVVASDVDLGVLTRLQARFPEVRIAHNDNRAAAALDRIFLGLHPPVLADSLREIRGSLKPDAIVISLAPKISRAKLAEGLAGFDRIVRLIPNAASIIGCGFNPISFSPALTVKEKEEVVSFLRALGQCPEVAEDKLEAYAIVTAMGPTYLWFQLRELQMIGESIGLTQEEAGTGVAEMIAGAGRTLFGSGMTAEEVMDLIPVRPLGDEEAGIKAMYHAKLVPLYKKLKG